MIRTIIIEKENGTRNELKSLIHDAFPDIELEGEFSRLTAGMHEFNMLKPDLVFLDTSSLLNGALDVFLSNPGLSASRIVIMAQEGESKKGYNGSDIFEFITKPFNQKELKSILQKIISQVEIERYIIRRINRTLGREYKKILQDKKIVLKTNHTLHIVQLYDLIRCEADKNYTYCFLEGGDKILVSKTLNDFFNLLKDYDFIRPHKSHLVNLGHINAMDRANANVLILSDKSEVPVSHRKREEIYRKLSSSYLHF